jgi:predicted ArsR family transcriptional regulator
VDEPPNVFEQIVILLRADGPLTMSQIAARLGRNPGGIQQRLRRMAQTGRVMASEGPKGWTVYSVPDDTTKEGR